MSGDVDGDDAAAGAVRPSIDRKRRAAATAAAPSDADAPSTQKGPRSEDAGPPAVVVAELAVRVGGWKARRPVPEETRARVDAEEPTLTHEARTQWPLCEMRKRYFCNWGPARTTRWLEFALVDTGHGARDPRRHGLRTPTLDLPSSACLARITRGGDFFRLAVRVDDTEGGADAVEGKTALRVVVLWVAHESLRDAGPVSWCTRDCAYGELLWVTLGDLRRCAMTPSSPAAANFYGYPIPEAVVDLMASRSVRLALAQFAAMVAPSIPRGDPPLCLHPTVLYHGKDDGGNWGLMVCNLLPSAKGMLGGGAVYLSHFYSAARYARWTQDWKPFWNDREGIAIRCVCVLGRDRVVTMGSAAAAKVVPPAPLPATADAKVPPSRLWVEARTRRLRAYGAEWARAGDAAWLRPTWLGWRPADVTREEALDTSTEALKATQADVSAAAARAGASAHARGAGFVVGASGRAYTSVWHVRNEEVAVRTDADVLFPLTWASVAKGTMSSHWDPWWRGARVT